MKISWSGVGGLAEKIVLAILESVLNVEKYSQLFGTPSGETKQAAAVELVSTCMRTMDDRSAAAAVSDTAVIEAVKAAIDAILVLVNALQHTHETAQARAAQGE